MAMSSTTRLGVMSLALILTQCERRNRIGEHVWVIQDGMPVRAFIVERTGEARVRVQFEGCDATWQREITTDRITRRVSDVEAARLPVRPACAPTSAARKGDPVGLAAPFKVGDRVRVRWRGFVQRERDRHSGPRSSARSLRRVRKCLGRGGSH
jgi:hypothetical protein